MFKPYCLAMSIYGPRVFPAEAFEAFCEQYRYSSWACYLGSPEEEEIFRQFKPGYAWLIKSARRRGFGS